MKTNPTATRKLSSPTFEKIVMPHDGSMLVRHFREERRRTQPFWHYHPELELVYVRKGSGKRHIGSHLSYFSNGELVLIGSNLPHQGFTDRLNEHESETVIQMPPDFLGDGFFQIPEMQSIQQLFERAKKGISFSQSEVESVGSKIEKLVTENKFDQILSIIGILKDLSLSEHYTILNANGFSLVAQPQDNDRLNKVLNHIRQHFQRPIMLEEICDLVSMTEPSFCRYFKRITNKTFTQFLNEYRLVHASKLLTEKQISITEVCFESGFSNYSHFIKQFKSFTGKSPSEYRKTIRNMLQ